VTDTLWTILIALVVLAAVLAPVATLRYLSVLARRRERRGNGKGDPD